MITIPVKTCGDVWLNPQEVQETLENLPPNEAVTFDCLNEGPSLNAIGLVAMTERICQLTNRDHRKFMVTNTMNPRERLPYRMFSAGLPHTFGMLQKFWVDFKAADDDARLFGLFIGRRTPSRAVMLRDCHTDFRSHCVLSLMNSLASSPWERPVDGIDVDPFDQWVAADDKDKFSSWWASRAVTSIDQQWVNRQYEPGYNTNLALLDYYHRFHIELVAETFTRGDTWYPTEKTLRPMMAGKPVLVHGPKGFLKTFRSMGYMTYGDVWSEKYDELEGPERWAAIKQVMSTLVSYDSITIQQLLSEAQTRARHNRQILATLNRLPA